jgi:O-antigen/teichoic acid export membrane protein
VFQKIKTISLNVAVYGMGDVATHIVGFLLLPLFTRFLTKDDYGVWSLLLTASLIAKIVFRWGVDASFMRFFYDCEDERDRQRLASTIFFFLLAANGAILLVALAAAPFYSEWLFGVPGKTLALQLMIASTFVGGFFFLPFHVFRIRNQARKFTVLTFTRSASTLGIRVLLVMGLHFGVMGLVWSEFAMTLVFAAVLLRWFAPLIRPTFSRRTLDEVLRFGLPRVPHGIAQQIVGPTTDSFLLRMLLPGDGLAKLQTIGLYGVGAGIGLALKLFLSAFEYAWAPFYFQTMKEKDAPRTFAAITTYGFAVLVLMSAGLSAVAVDLVRLMTAPKFHDAALVIPWITVAVTLQGVYLLTSIGMNITRHTEYYPLAAGAAAASNILANVLLIPRFGMMGPAWSNVVSYAVLAGVAFALSQRFYPIRYERGRLARVVAAGVVSYLTAVFVLPDFRLAIVGVVARGTTVLVLYLAILGATGFFHAKELSRLKTFAAQLRSARGRKAVKEAQAEREPGGEALPADESAVPGFEQEP